MSGVSGVSSAFHWGFAAPDTADVAPSCRRHLCYLLLATHTLRARTSDGAGEASDRLPIESRTNRYGDHASLGTLLIRVERGVVESGSEVLTTLDISHERGPQRGLRAADLGDLRFLHALSVRGCGNLKALRLPYTLTALDASAASDLTRMVAVGAAVEGTSAGAAAVEVLNLNGCRRLGSWCFELRKCRELDLSWCQALPQSTIASEVGRCSRLMSCSLRAVASDAGELRSNRPPPHHLSIL